MVYNIIRMTGLWPNTRKEVLAQAESKAEAKALAHKMFPIIDYEDDAQYQHCADFYTAHGEVLCIEPEGFTLVKG